MDSRASHSSGPRSSDNKLYLIVTGFLVGLVIGVLVAPSFSHSLNGSGSASHASTTTRTLIGAPQQPLDCSDFILPRNFSCPPPPPPRACHCDCDVNVKLPSFPPCPSHPPAAAAACPVCAPAAPAGACDWSALPDDAPSAPWFAVPTGATVSGRAILAANRKSTTPQLVPSVSHYLRNLFHMHGQVVSPYAGFEKGVVPGKRVEWTQAGPLLDLVRELRPKVYVEAGVWMGTSFIAVTKELESLGLTDSYAVAIDTWLGALEFMCARNRGDLDDARNLNPRFGYPSSYYFFLSNILEAGIAHRVVPVAQTSQLGAKFLIARGIKAQVIYIDGSHEYDDVKADMLLYWHVLDHSNPDSALVGDDLTWRGVKKAVEEFVSLYCTSKYSEGDHAKWWLRSKQCPNVPPPPDLSEGCRE